MTDNTHAGDTVKTSPYTFRGKVVKVKPDGTRLIRTAAGTLLRRRSPQKPLDPPDDRRSGW